MKHAGGHLSLARPWVNSAYREVWASDHDEQGESMERIGCGKEREFKTDAVLPSNVHWKKVWPPVEFYRGPVVPGLCTATAKGTTRTRHKPAQACPGMLLAGLIRRD